MSEENVRQVLQSLSGKIPEEKMPLLKNSQANADDKTVDAIL